MKIFSESQIGRDGTQYITIMAKEPVINKWGLYNGGLLFSFEIDHIKLTTKLYTYKYINGVPNGFDKCLKTWKEETLTAAECLKYCEKNFTE